MQHFWCVQLVLWRPEQVCRENRQSISTAYREVDPIFLLAFNWTSRQQCCSRSQHVNWIITGKVWVCVWGWVLFSAAVWTLNNQPFSLVLTCTLGFFLRLMEDVNPAQTLWFNQLQCVTERGGGGEVVIKAHKHTYTGPTHSCRHKHTLEFLAFKMHSSKCGYFAGNIHRTYFTQTH